MRSASLILDLQEIKIDFFNDSLQIGIVNWREVYLLQPRYFKNECWHK